MNNLVIGVDIGGTRTKSGLVNIATGEVIHSIVQPTEKKYATVFIQQIGVVIDQFRELAAEKGNSIAGIGMGIPGFTGEDGEVITTYGFLEFMENYPVKRIIEKEFSLPCFIDNDARVVGLGEALYGKGKGYKRVLTLTLGTGVGFGFVVNGCFTEPLPLQHMGGHIKITDTGERCYCGKTGCLEALVSSAGILNIARNTDNLQELLSAEAVFEAASKGNYDARNAVAQIIEYLHTAIHNYINLFAPDMVVLGGGIAKGLAPYIERIKGDAYLSPYPNYSFQLAVSELEELAGMLGSAALFQLSQDITIDNE
ncbi:MAG: ROK family protein [Ferruginibacter sp.]|nr:ROK family protein [Ferruginibacter sp.]